MAHQSRTLQHQQQQPHHHQRHNFVSAATTSGSSSSYHNPAATPSSSSSAYVNASIVGARRSRGEGGGESERDGGEGGGGAVLLENRIAQLESMLSNFVQQRGDATGNSSSSGGDHIHNHNHNNHRTIAGGEPPYQQRTGIERGGGNNYNNNNNMMEMNSANYHHSLQRGAPLYDNYNLQAAEGGGGRRHHPTSTAAAAHQERDHDDVVQRGVRGGVVPAQQRQHNNANNNGIYNAPSYDNGNYPPPPRPSTTATTHLHQQPSPSSSAIAAGMGGSFARPPPLPSAGSTPRPTTTYNTNHNNNNTSSSMSSHQQNYESYQQQLRQIKLLQEATDEKNRQCLVRIAELERALAEAQETVAKKDYELKHLKAKLDAQQGQLEDAELRLASAISLQKASEAAAVAANLSAKRDIEATEKSSRIWWGTVQTLRSAFEKQEAQVEIIKREREAKEKREERQGGGGGASRLVSNSSGQMLHLVATHGAKIERHSLSSSVAANGSGAGGVGSRSNKNDAEGRGLKIGLKRDREAETRTGGEGGIGDSRREIGNNGDDLVFAPAMRPPTGAAPVVGSKHRSHFGGGGGGNSSFSAAPPAVANASYSYYDEDNDVDYYSKYQHTPTSKNDGGGSKKKLRQQAVPGGKTPRTPSVTGAEKIAPFHKNNNNHHYNVVTKKAGDDVEESMSSVYKGPKGVSQMSDGGGRYVNKNAVFTGGASSAGAISGGVGGRTPPFSPAPKPTPSAVPISNGTGANNGTSALKNEDLSPVLDFNKNYNKRGGLRGEAGEEKERGGEESAGVSVANTSLGATSSLRSHTKFNSLRKDRGGGFMTRSPTPTNPTRGPDTDRRFVLSGVSEEDKRLITAAVKQLGQKGVVVDGGIDQPPPPSCTHVVIPGMPQSFKALCGLVSCRWLVTPQYIFDSLAAGFWLNEEDCNHVRCHPPPLAHQRFMVSLQQGNTNAMMSQHELKAMKERLEYVIKFGDGIIVEEGSAASGVVIIQSGDDIFNYCLRPQH